MLIPFNQPCVIGTESQNLAECITHKKFSGNGHFSKLCQRQIESRIPGMQAFLTTSCTDALEMAALMAEIRPGDEVIMPSFTFVSTANAFALRGARIVFVDIDPKSMNVDPQCVLSALSPRTKAVVVVHYGGWSCDMDSLVSQLPREVVLIEDAAQAIGASYRGKALGTFGRFSTLSFHETKNIQCGEGGALVVRSPLDAERAEILRDKGTDMARFHRGEVAEYSWRDLGSSFLPSELNSAFLSAQLDQLEAITQKRLQLWKAYEERLAPLHSEVFEMLTPPEYSQHNGHMVAVKLNDKNKRDELIRFLASHEINSRSHYVPLHSSQGGERFGEFRGIDRFTTKESQRLTRLPLYYEMSVEQVERVCDKVQMFIRGTG